MAETSRNDPEGQLHVEPIRTVPCAEGQAVHDVAVISQVAQDGSQAAHILPFKK